MNNNDNNDEKKQHVDIMCSWLIMYLTLLSIAVCACLHFLATRFNAYMHQLDNYVSAFAVWQKFLQKFLSRDQSIDFNPALTQRQQAE